MENIDGSKLVDFTEEGRRELINYVWPEMSEADGIKKISTFIKYIILK